MIEKLKAEGPGFKSGPCHVITIVADASLLSALLLRIWHASVSF